MVPEVTIPGGKPVTAVPGPDAQISCENACAGVGHCRSGQYSVAAGRREVDGLVRVGKSIEYQQREYQERESQPTNAAGFGSILILTLLALSLTTRVERTIVSYLASVQICSLLR